MERIFLDFIVRQKFVSRTRMIKRFFRLWLFGPRPANTQNLKLFYLAGETEEDVRSWAEQCWLAKIRPQLFPGMILLVEQLRSRSISTVLLSGTPGFLAEPLAHHLKVDDVIAADPEIVEGKLTGALVVKHPFKDRKVSAAQEWLAAKNIPWEQVIAFGNHQGDRHLLERVKIPVAVKPDSSLRTTARQQGWMIIDDTVSGDVAEKVMSKLALDPSDGA
jgi:HAD superfamily phosphoserine phosphatase-like hydrolase